MSQMQRITVIGTPGTGKTTLAQQLANKLKYPFIELDALFWEPQWTPVSPSIFRQRVQEAVSGNHWTTGGNYSIARDIIWRRSDTIIWLDYPLSITFSRLLRRTIKRITTQEELWAGNRETWKSQFFSHDSLLLFALRTHYQRKVKFPRELLQAEYSHVKTLRFCHPKETQRWLNQI